MKGGVSQNRDASQTPSLNVLCGAVTFAKPV